MSSAPPASLPQRRPAQEESTGSERNKLAIRIVPYSPPRAASGSGRPQDAESPPTAAPDGSEVAPDGQLSGKASEQRDSIYALSSPASSTASLATSRARARASSVSGTRAGSSSSGVAPSTPPHPGPSMAAHGSFITRVNAHNAAPSHPQHAARQASSTQRPVPRVRSFREISLNSDSTFSVVLKSTRGSSGTGASLRSPIISNISTISSYDRDSSNASIGDIPSSPPTSVGESSSSQLASLPWSEDDHGEDLIAASPWNYQMIGGLRKVPRTPDLKRKGKEPESAGSTPEPSLPEESASSPALPSPLATRQSFSGQSGSTIEETTNYKVVGQSSPGVPDSDSIQVSPSPIRANFEVIAASSPAQTIEPRSEFAIDDTPGSRNFVVHSGTPQSQALASPSRRNRYSDDDLRLRAQYSQESLVVPPLNTRRRSLSYLASASRESLRSRRSSFSRSRANSISSIISQETVSAFYSNTPNIVRLASTASPSPSPHRQWAGPSRAVVNRTRMDTHPHVWSSQLSTVPSESEGASERNSSRAFSQGSIPVSQVSVPEYRSSLSGYGSRGSRNILSISSSQAGIDELPQSGRSSLDPGVPPYMRGARELPSTPGPALVRDVDEHGDGLADLNYQPHHNSSRPRLGHPASNRSLSSRSLSSKASDRNLHSSAGSFTASTIPVWARMYYGSGERRWWAAPSIRSYGDDSRPGSAWDGPSQSPSYENFPVVSPRKRPREVHPADRPTSVVPFQGVLHQPREGSIRRGVRQMTSSIWSPHLDYDRRASRYSMWEPPSMTWSAEGGLGPRNAQVVLFSLGFILPLAWMIAAVLPLPKKRLVEMAQRDTSTSMFEIPEDTEAGPRPAGPVDDLRFQSAQWWRNLNRIMSVIGLLIIGAVIALVIVGLRQNWSIGR